MILFTSNFRKYRTLQSIVFFSLIVFGKVYSQTEIGIAPGESKQILRENTISILPLTDVGIEILGEDSIFVAGSVDSFRLTTETLNVRTYYSLYVVPSAPNRELSIRVALSFKADNVLSQVVNEDFLIDTNVLPSIIADFSAEPRTGDAPLIVNFTNQSTGEIVGFYWDFGDEFTSSEQNPQHIYESEGDYSVTLTAFNFTVQNQITKEGFISVNDPTWMERSYTIITDKMELVGNYPNPFNPSTTISFKLNQKRKVSLSIYNLNGEIIQVLVDDILDRGLHQFHWRPARKIPSGIYFYQLRSSNFVQTKQMLMLK